MSTHPEPPVVTSGFLALAQEKKLTEEGFASYLDAIIEERLDTEPNGDRVLRVEGNKVYYIDSEDASVFCITCERIVP